mmetsp:Transcript_73200/g.202010  ORF Transcript_73200/g.202010 Transcript_73200/m.202010 type:complete len:261 (+) Transcript_73200:365-1147(+)
MTTMFGCLSCLRTLSSLQSAGSLRIASSLRLPPGSFAATSIPQKTAFMTTPKPPRPNTSPSSRCTSSAPMRQCSASPRPAMPASRCSSAPSEATSKIWAVVPDTGSEADATDRCSDVVSVSARASSWRCELLGWRCEPLWWRANSASQRRLRSRMTARKARRSKSSEERLPTAEPATSPASSMRLKTEFALPSTLPTRNAIAVYTAQLTSSRGRRVCHRIGSPKCAAVTKPSIASRTVESVPQNPSPKTASILWPCSFTQ